VPDTVFGLPVVERDPWPDGRVVVFLASPFRYERKPIVSSAIKPKRAVVPIAGLVGTQRSVTVEGVERYLTKKSRERPLVYETPEGTFIANGHHRLVASWLRGDKTAVVDLVKVGAGKPASERVQGSMDPEANYQEQARLYGSKDKHDRARRRELVSALREWVRGGGFKPSGYTGPAYKPAKRAKGPRAPLVTVAREKPELRRVYLNAGGYTSGKYGKYFGRGAPLFEYDHAGKSGYLRASSRADAMDQLRKMFPDIAPSRKKGGKKSALQHHGGLNNPGTGREILVNGLLVIGGAAAAIKLDQKVTARPLGLPPSAFALAGSVAVVVVASKYKRRKIARGAAAVAIGVASGMVASRLGGSK